ncbi:MAG: VTT domain-containing protein [Anaerolineae bacterium]|nr:VTT domain-containing protein [Anaerolineae bacterium]
MGDIERATDVVGTEGKHPGLEGATPPPESEVAASDDAQAPRSVEDMASLPPDGIAGLPPESATIRARQPGNWLWKLAGVFLALVITVVVYMLRDRLREVAEYGYLGLFLISVLGNATIVLPMPTLVTAFIGGGVFNPILVGVISAAGATLGELTGYLAGLSGQAVIENQKMYDRFSSWMEKYGLIALFLLAAFPNPFFDVAGIIAGMSRLRLTTYFSVVWAGKIVKFVLIAYLGAGSVELLDLLGVR